MQTLTYGRKKPDTGDPGSTFFPALEDNIDLNDAHSHDGVDSVKLTSYNITAGTITGISGADWVAQGGGRYRATVNLPAGFNWDTAFIQCRDTGNGSIINPTIEKVSTTQMYIYVNDNTLTVGVRLF